MVKKRLIPVLLLKNGWLVQSKGFKEYKNLGNPTTAVKRLSEWAADELIYLDISTDDVYDIKREDQGYPNRKNLLEIISDVSNYAFMPITIGGKIRKIENINQYLENGADKVCVNQITRTNPSFVKESSNEFGSQCIVVSIDVRLVDGVHRLFAHEENKTLEDKALDWALKMQDLGAGEIFLNSVDRDGMQTGYDIEFISKVSDTLDIPIIASGGAGDWDDFSNVLSNTSAKAVAAANIFHYKDQSVYLAKKHLFEKNIYVREPFLIDI